MPLIIETVNFSVVASDQQHHSRENGGHIIIFLKQQYAEHFDLPLDVARDMMQLSMVVGEAATIALRRRGIDVIRINYQENGNWAYKPGAAHPPNSHLHLFIRTSHETHPDGDPRFQAFREALTFAAYGFVL